MARSSNPNRRQFFAAAPAAGVSVALSVNGAEAATPEAAPPEDDNRRVELKDSEHIRTYYQLARN